MPEIELNNRIKEILEAKKQPNSKELVETKVKEVLVAFGVPSDILENPTTFRMLSGIITDTEKGNVRVYNGELSNSDKYWELLHHTPNQTMEKASIRVNGGQVFLSCSNRYPGMHENFDVHEQRSIISVDEESPNIIVSSEVECKRSGFENAGKGAIRKARSIINPEGYEISYSISDQKTEIYPGTEIKVVNLDDSPVAEYHYTNIKTNETEINFIPNFDNVFAKTGNGTPSSGFYGESLEATTDHIKENQAIFEDKLTNEQKNSVYMAPRLNSVFETGTVEPIIRNI